MVRTVATMRPLRQDLLRAVGDGRFLVTRHATERLRSRRIPLWQVVDVTLTARIWFEHPHRLPHPTAECHGVLPDGRTLCAVWSWVVLEQEARLVTAFVPERRRGRSSA